VVQALAPVFRGIFHTIGDIITGFVRAVQAIVGVVQVVSNRVTTIFRSMGNIIGGIWRGITGVVRSVFNTIIDIVNNVIGAINRIQVHIHVGPVNYDFNGLNIGYIPRLHTGGIVPGVAGTDVLTMLQAGERVVPRNQVGGESGVTIVVQGSIYGVDDLMDIIAMRLKLQGA
jgi:hypothetical protein